MQRSRADERRPQYGFIYAHCAKHSDGQAGLQFYTVGTKNLTNIRPRLCTNKIGYDM